jgi:hypothetical protein
LGKEINFLNIADGHRSQMEFSPAIAPRRLTSLPHNCGMRCK